MRGEGGGNLNFIYDDKSLSHGQINRYRDNGEYVDCVSVSYRNESDKEKKIEVAFALPKGVKPSFSLPESAEPTKRAPQSVIARIPKDGGFDKQNVLSRQGEFDFYSFEYVCQPSRKPTEEESEIYDDMVYDEPSFSAKFPSAKGEHDEIGAWVLGSFAGGSGTSGDPYQIENLYQPQLMKDGLSSSYELNNDIDASFSNPDNVSLWVSQDYTAGEWVKYDDSGTVKTYYCTDDTTDSQVPTDTDFWAEMWVSAEGWLPVGTSANRFTGSLDGQGYEISGLFINRPATNYVGMFGYTASTTAKIRRVGVINADITGNGYTGILAGFLVTPAELCFTSGTVYGNDWFAGGFCGRTGARLFEDCYTTASVETSANNLRRGGFCGQSYRGDIRRCYSTGQVLPTGGSMGGGFTGDTDTGGSYADTANFYDTETSGWSTSAMGVGRTTAQMKDISTYTVAGYQDNGITAGQEWDIKNVFRHRTETWKIHKRITYPLLSFQKYVFTRIHQMLLGRNF